MLRLKATSLERFMTSGRTTPALFGCVDQNGAPAGEYVVKLRGGLETGNAGLVRELLAAKLATQFGIASPSQQLSRSKRRLRNCLPKQSLLEQAAFETALG